MREGGHVLAFYITKLISEINGLSGASGSHWKEEEWFGGGKAVLFQLSPLLSQWQVFLPAKSSVPVGRSL